MIGFSSILCEELEKSSHDESLKQYSSMLLSSSERTLEMLDSLLVWAKSESGVIDIQKEVVKASDIINDVSNIYEGLLHSKLIRLTFKSETLYYAISDTNILKTIYRNLLSNAIKFSHIDSEIIVKVYNEADKIILSVQDFGVGISKANQENLLSVGSKNSRIGTQGEVGSGFGLIMIKDLAEKNGGQLWFESEEGVGSTFYVSVQKVED